MPCAARFLLWASVAAPVLALTSVLVAAQSPSSSATAAASAVTGACHVSPMRLAVAPDPNNLFLIIQQPPAATTQALTSPAS